MPVKWTQENEDIVRSMYPNSTYEEIVALIPNLSKNALVTKAQDLGVVKSEEYLNTAGIGVTRSVRTRRGKPAWNSKEWPEITCQGCGKLFKVEPYRKDKAKYCSSKCMGKVFKSTGILAGKNNPHYNKVDHVCKRCGKTFKVKLAHDKKGIYRYCSNACKKAEYVEVPCKWCQHPIRMTVFQRDKGRKQFCSFGCHGAYSAYMIQGQPTSIEKAVEQVLIALSEAYKPQKQMGPYILDFYLPQYRLAIEADGDYWHTLPNVIEKDKKKDHWLAAHDYRLLRLTETDIKANAMKAVTDGLHKLVHGFTSSPVVEQSSLWTL